MTNSGLWPHTKRRMDSQPKGDHREFLPTGNNQSSRTPNELNKVQNTTLNLNNSHFPDSHTNCKVYPT
jgi:hypothetical protein